MSSTALDVRTLLTIDVDAEIRKLGRAPLAAAEQLPALLAARALRSGAGRVAVKLGARHFEVVDDGAPIDAFRLADLAVLLEPGRSPSQRHAALLALEGGRCAGLLALAALDGARRIQIESGATCLDWRRGRAARLLEPGSPAGSRVRVEGLRLAASEVRRRLSESCRFAAARVEIDAQPLARGFQAPLGEVALRPPLQGRLALPAGAEREARVWLLLDGAVVTHATLAGLPAFEAAIEMAPLLGGDAEPAALRDTVLSFAQTLGAQALELLAELARDSTRREPAAQQALRGHVLRALRRHPAERRLGELEIIPAIGPGGVGALRLSLRQVAARAAHGPLPALFPDQEPAGYRLPPAPVLLLDASERGLLDRISGIRVVAPPRRWRALRLERARLALRDALRGSLRRLRRLRPVRPVPEHRRTPQERALLVALRPLLPEPSTRLELCAGGGLPRRRGATLWLPREAATVRDAARALAREGDSFAGVVLRALGLACDAPP